MQFLLSHYLHIVYLITQKTSMVIIKVKLYEKVLWRFKKACGNSKLWKKEMILLAVKENKLYWKQKVCTDNKDKKYYVVRDHCHYTGKYKGAAHKICNLRYKKLKKIPLAFHNASKYNYHFIIKELPENSKANLNAVEKIQKIYNFFSINK